MQSPVNPAPQRDQQQRIISPLLRPSPLPLLNPAFSPPISPRTLAPPTSSFSGIVPSVQALDVSTANALIETSPLSSDSDSSTHRFEMQQTAEILCMLADNDGSTNNLLLPQDEDDADQLICTEECCQSSNEACMHQFPLGGFPAATVRDVDAPQQSSLQMAPWAIYTNYPPQLQPQQSSQFTHDGDVVPPLTDEEWSALTSPVDSIPWDASADIESAEGGPVLSVPEEDSYLSYHHSIPYDSDDFKYIGSPLVEDFLSTCLPPDTPADERREWYNFLSASNEDKSSWPRFLGEVPPDGAMAEEGGGVTWEPLMYHPGGYTT